MPEIQRVSIKHEAIMDFLMMHPTIKLGDVAKHFGVTQPWLSCVIHSDAFQNLLREKQGIAFHHTVLPMREKIAFIANLALDKLAETLPFETETSSLQKVADSALDRLGYASKAIPQGGVQINNNNVQVNVLKSELDEARQLLGRVGVQPLSPLEVQINGNRSPIGLPLQGEDTTKLGETFEGTSLRFPDQAQKIPEAKTGT